MMLTGENLYTGKEKNIMTTIGDFLNIAKQVIEYFINLIQTYLVPQE